MSHFEFLDSEISMPMMKLPVRTTIIQINERRLLLSPGSQLSLEQLTSAGEITDIVAPSLLHCGGMKKAISVFPNAQVWGPVGATEAKPEIPWTDFLSQDRWPFEKTLSLLSLQGVPGSNECVFIHRPSGTLIVTDLFFNLTQASGVGSFLILKAFGTYRRFGMSRLFKSFVKDKAAFTESLKQLLREDFNRVIMSHGEILQGGHSAVRKALVERDFEV